MAEFPRPEAAVGGTCLGAGVDEVDGPVNPAVVLFDLREDCPEEDGYRDGWDEVGPFVDS